MTEIIVIWVICSFIVGGIGASYKIGYWTSFGTSLVFSPIIGFLAVMFSMENSEPPKNTPKKLDPATEAYLRKRKYTTCFEVVGILYYDYDIIAKKRLIKATTPIKLVREPKNRKDNNAIIVYFADYKLGYVPRYEAEKLALILDDNTNYSVYLNSYSPRKYYDERIELEFVNEDLKSIIEDETV
jgi:hypothetical protein